MKLKLKLLLLTLNLNPARYCKDNLIKSNTKGQANIK